MNKMMSVMISLFTFCMIPCIYANVLQPGVSPRKQRRLLNKARRLQGDPLLSRGLSVSDFSSIPTDPLLSHGPLDSLLNDHQRLINHGLVDPVLSHGPLDSLLNDHQGLINPGFVDPHLSHGPLDSLLNDHQRLINPGFVDPHLSHGPLDSLLNGHQGLLPMGLGSQAPRMDPITRDLISRNKAIGTRESLRQNRQIKKQLRRARKQFRQDKRARKQIRKQGKLIKIAAKQANIIGGPQGVIGLPAPLSPLHADHHIAEKLLINDALNINPATHDRKARRQIKKQRKLLKKAAKQASIIGGALDVIPAPEPFVPIQPDHHLAEKILINDALNMNTAKQDKKARRQIKKQRKLLKKAAKQAQIIGGALNVIPAPEPFVPIQPDHHLAEKILINDALNKGSLLGAGGIHDTHLHSGGTLIKITDADHPPPHHPLNHPPPHHLPPAQPKPNKLQSLVKGVLLGGIGAMLLGK